MKARKITFTNVGVISGSRIWRNLETGVEIVKGRNFSEVGLYYVCMPTRGGGMDRRVAGSQKTMSYARSFATGYVLYMRDHIAAAHQEALEEDSSRYREGVAKRTGYFPTW